MTIYILPSIVFSIPLANEDLIETLNNHMFLRKQLHINKNDFMKESLKNLQEFYDKKKTKRNSHKDSKGKCVMWLEYPGQAFEWNKRDIQLLDYSNRCSRSMRMQNACSLRSCRMACKHRNACSAVEYSRHGPICKLIGEIRDIKRSHPSRTNSIHFKIQNCQRILESVGTTRTRVMKNIGSERLKLMKTISRIKNQNPSLYPST
ncbi:hypothetical protein SNEBB_005640 [Seison nebaliae]|nr:hypothetical protein SNEBB_005640 [Seison nebaliae]